MTTQLSPHRSDAYRLSEVASERDSPDWDCAFCINGRFYSQSTTGVQRYARELVLAMDAILYRAGGHGSILMPATARNVPLLKSLDTITVGTTKGYLWEQIQLPFKAETPIVNLCNTAPVLSALQTVCIHDANVFLAPDSYSPSFRLVYQKLLPLLARRSAFLTTVSDYSRSQIAKYLSLPAKEILVIPNGHEHAFSWNAASSTLGQRLANIRPFVLLLGSRARHKNTNFVLNQAEALDRLGLDLVVVGGSARIFAQMQTLTGTNVHWLGVVSDDDLAYLYGHAMCLAFPSFSEGFGLPLVEAMALGCPIIASNRSSMPEVCGQAALLAPPDDGSTWKAHFEKLVNSADLRAELTGRGYEQVKKFSWPTSALSYLKILGHLI